MDQIPLFHKIDSTETYSAAYKTKLKETYCYFSMHGFFFREHALNRFLGQRTGKGKFSYSKEELLFLLRRNYNYRQPDGKLIRHYGNIAAVSAPDTEEIVSIIVKDRPRKDWIGL